MGSPTTDTDSGAEAAPAPRAGHSWPLWIKVTALIALGTALTLAFELLIARTDLYPTETPNREVFVVLVLLVAGMIAAGIAFLPVSTDTKGLLWSMLVGAMLSTTYFMALKGTPFGLNGLSGDATFRTALVVKSSVHTWPFADFAYADLASWYPPLYYWTLGKVAAVLGIEPFQMLKFGAITAAYAVPVASYLVWRSITRKPLWGLAAALTTLVVVDLYKVAGWISLVLFVPWWLFFMEGVGADDRRRSVGWFLIGGLLGGLIFQTYFYYFFVGGVALLISWPLRRFGYLPGRMETIRNQLTMIVSVAAFSSLYWLPYVVSMARTGGWEQIASRWFRPSMAIIPLPFLNMTVRGAVMLIGLVWLIWAFSRSGIARHLLVMVAAAYVWIAFGFLTFVLDHPLLTFRSRILIEYVLVLAALFGAAEVVGFAARRVERKSLIVPGVAALVVFMLFFGQLYARDLSKHQYTENAHAAEYPHERIDSFEQATGGSYQDSVVMSSYTPVTVLLPVFNFNVWNAHYANAAARWRDRTDLLVQAAALSDPAAFATAIFHNRYGEIDYVMPDTVEGGYRIRYQDDAFPNGLENKEVLIRPELLESPYFEMRRAGPTLLFVPNRDLDPYQPDTCVDGSVDCAWMDELDGTIGRHLSLTGSPAD